ncbi:MAG: hypothetical protein C0596_16055 [Marinilabiliales bacterium]|nr:MAG: hypothetical protein C0596_16055 [Marinilabiliales bacterium]
MYIDYNTESEENMIYMSIFNADGKMVDTRQLKYKQDIVIINTVDLQPGTYIIRLYSKSKSFGEQIVTKI